MFQRSKPVFANCILALGSFLFLTVSGWSASYKVIVPFSGSNGLEPVAGLIFDASGNAYGTTQGGGPNGKGEVYQLSPTSGFHIIYAFHGKDGYGPMGNLTMDSQGDLYGTTYAGGSYKNCYGACGTIFKLAPPVGNGNWTETVLYSFTGGGDGQAPVGGVILDQAGNLYGTTQLGGTFGQGVVFQLTPSPTGWTESAIYSFTGGNDGNQPLCSLVSDSTGNLFGTTSHGGQGGVAGSIFELTSQGSGLWTFSVIHEFALNGEDGSSPTAGLIFDDIGNLYGTTAVGGSNRCGGSGGCGTVFELAQDSGAWEETILHSFDGSDGYEPVASLVLDSEGDIYGTTFFASQGAGNIFELKRPLPGQNWTERFFNLPADGHLGQWPKSSLSFDRTGGIYGTTFAGGPNGTNSGAIFRIAP